VVLDVQHRLNIYQDVVMEYKIKILMTSIVDLRYHSTYRYTSKSLYYSLLCNKCRGLLSLDPLCAEVQP
jgi:hypothetical protein